MSLKTAAGILACLAAVVWLGHSGLWRDALLFLLRWSLAMIAVRSIWNNAVRGMFPRLPEMGLRHATHFGCGFALLAATL